MTKIRSSMFSFLLLSLPHISVPPIFKIFIIELGFGNFGCGFVPPFCMRLLEFLKSGPPPHLGGTLNPPPQRKKKLKQFPRILNTVIKLECWNFLCEMGLPLCLGLFRIFFPSPLTPQKSNSSFIARFWWYWKHIFICLSIIIEIIIYYWINNN